MATKGDYGVRWTAFNRKGELVGVEKFFSTEKALDRFVEELTERPNFHEVQAFCGPRAEAN